MLSVARWIAVAVTPVLPIISSASEWSRTFGGTGYDFRFGQTCRG
jgi:hypothetical protein